MSLPRWLIPTALVVAFFVFIFAIKGVLLPFVAGLAIAYLFDPVADRLEALKLPRWAAAGTILLGFFLFVTIFFILLWPLVSHQVGGLIQKIPKYINQLEPYLQSLLERAGQDDVKGLASDYGAKVVSLVTDTVTGFIGQGLALFNILSLLLLTPLVAFYLLREWDRMVAQIDGWLPLQHRGTIERLAGEADAVLSGFVRGQLTVATIMGTLYAIGWSIIGLDYAIVLAIIAALLCFIPYIGPLTGSLLALLVGFGQFGTENIVPLLSILGVHLGVQLLEGNILTPRIVGPKVGLSDVWVIFAILVGAELMGFVGIFIAVPVAAIAAVLLRFALERYLASSLYTGGQKTEGPTQE